MCKMKEERDEEQGVKCWGFVAAAPWPLCCVPLWDCRPVAPFPVFSDSSWLRALHSDFLHKLSSVAFISCSFSHTLHNKGFLLFYFFLSFSFGVRKLKRLSLLGT